MTSSLTERWTFFDKLFQNLRFRRVIDLIPQEGILADLGCGDGDFLEYVLLKRRIAICYGVDSTIRPLNNNRYNCIFKKGDLNREIPLLRESIDIVTTLAVLEHLHNPGKFITEIYRILKYGGYCILTTPSPKAKVVLELLAYKLKMISENDVRDHKNYFDKDALMRLFTDFSLVKIELFLLGFNTIVIAKK